MKVTEDNKLDWSSQRCQSDTMSKSLSKSRLMLILGTMVLTATLYPVLRMLGIQIYAALSGTYVAGHHSMLLINCPTEQTAKDIGRHIMEKRMAACVNILPRTSTM